MDSTGKTNIRVKFSSKVDRNKVEDIVRKMEVGFEIRRVDVNKNKATYLLKKKEEDEAKKLLPTASEMIRAGELAVSGNPLSNTFLGFAARRIAESDQGREVRAPPSARGSFSLVFSCYSYVFVDSSWKMGRWRAGIGRCRLCRGRGCLSLVFSLIIFSYAL